MVCWWGETVVLTCCVVGVDVSVGVSVGWEMVEWWRIDGVDDGNWGRGRSMMGMCGRVGYKGRSGTGLARVRLCEWTVCAQTMTMGIFAG